MRGCLIWLVVALGCISAGAAEETSSQRVGPDPVYELIGTIAPTTPNPPSFATMDPEFERGLLKQIQYELDLSMKANSELETKLQELKGQLNELKKKKDNLVGVRDQRRSDLLSKRQRLAKIRVKLDHSWLLQERCPNFEKVDDFVRRRANQGADKRALEELYPKARKHFLSRYLRLLKALEYLTASVDLSPKPKPSGK